MKSTSFAGAAAALIASSLAAAQKPPGSEEALRERVVSLEARLAELEQGATPTQPSPPSQGLAWKDLISEGNKFKLYGFARFDVQYDDSRPNNPQTIGWILSEDPSAPAFAGSTPIGAGGEDIESLTMHARLSRLGLDVNGGTVASLANAVVSGKIEIDFFNNGLAGQSESRAALRMRHAYLKTVWGDFSVLYGQTSDVISPIYPIVNADLVMWGAGNLGDRRPQIRPEYVVKSGELSWIFQGEIGLSGADDNADLDTSGNYGAGYRDGESSGEPTLQARAACKFPVAGNATEVGVWAHSAKEEPDDANGTIPGDDEFESSAYGLDLTLPLFSDAFTLKAEAWQGKNVDDVRGGIFQGINTVVGKEIDSEGGFVEIGWNATDHVALYLGWANDNPDNEDLATNGRANNEIWYAAARFNYKPLAYGIEVLDWTTEYIPWDEGDDLRVVAFASYSF